MSSTRGFFMRTAKPAMITLALLLGTAAVTLAAEDHHAASGALLSDFLYRCLNFVVTFGLLAYFVTKPLRKGLSGRRDGIEKTLRDAQKAREGAEAKFAEYDSKLNKAAAEIAEIHDSIRKEGELEREKILANAREMAEKIAREAEKSAANEIAKARAELRREASHMAIEIAEEILKKNFTKADHTRLVDEYMQKVGELN
jgi:F-type H+-transporting ATPase subunit b